MKLDNAVRRAAIITLAFTAFASAHAIGKADKDKKDKVKASANQTVDSGSFGIFVNGKRVATESFKIEQQNGSSIIKSQLKGMDAEDSSSQKSDLEITSSGELLRYEWSQSSGGSITVFPENDFLKERIFTSAAAKPAEQAFLLPGTSPILDNNFFIQREVLAWKYLAIAPCKDESGHRHCEPADFGTLVPQDRTSMSVRVELVGKGKVTIRGAERELLRLNLHGDQFDWALWVDENDHFKLMRVAIPADNTVVDRD
ncbi:MAG TPA: hypothetical protein VGM18_06355 [Candidatus Sulfotelmatobacter sp.]